MYPWSRVQNPAPLTGLRAPQLAALDDAELGTLITQNLLPRDAESKGRWRNLWQVLTFDAELSRRAETILTGLLDTAEHAEEHREYQGEPLDDHQVRRATKFAEQVNDALTRLDRRDTDPLGWAGTRAARFNTPARAAIAALVAAIDTHRTVTCGPGGEVHEHDQELWRVLEAVGLDPLAERNGAQR